MRPPRQNRTIGRRSQALCPLVSVRGTDDESAPSDDACRLWRRAASPLADSGVELLSWFIHQRITRGLKHANQAWHCIAPDNITIEETS